MLRRRSRESLCRRARGLRLVYTTRGLRFVCTTNVAGPPTRLRHPQGWGVLMYMSLKQLMTERLLFLSTETFLCSQVFQVLLPLGGCARCL